MVGDLFGISWRVFFVFAWSIDRIRTSFVILYVCGDGKYRVHHHMFLFSSSYSLFYFSLYKLLHLAGVDLGVAFYKIREEKVNVLRPAISCLHINPIYT